MKNYQRAIYDISAAIQTFDKTANKKELGEYYFYAGLNYFELQQFDTALQNFDIAVEFDRTKGVYHYHRALLRSRLDRVPEAIKSYQDALGNLESDERDYMY